MPYLKVIGLPQINFAHVFSTDKYSYSIPKQKNRVEISYISEGSITVKRQEETVVFDSLSIHINLGTEDIEVFSNTFHEHHTVCFFTETEPCKDIKDGVFLPYKLNFKEKNKIHRLIDKIILDNTLYPEKSLSLSGAFLELLQEISVFSKIDDRNDGNSLTPLYVTKAKKYVYKHLKEPILQKEVAAHLLITPEYLCNIFKKATGESLIKFINSVKLTKIRALILHENLKLNQAAILYGYSDPNYVSKLYKKYYGHNITDFSFQKTRL